jgi:hypothetical protein
MDRLHLLVPVMLLASLPALWPLTGPGLYASIDGMLHYYRVVETTALLAHGVVFSRWLPDLAFGLGYPLFNYHGPLFAWAGGLLSLLLGGPEPAVKTLTVAGFVSGALGMYRLARQWVPAEGAAAAAVAFIYAPFYIREVYWQGDYPQFLGLSLEPWLLFFLYRVLVGGAWADALGLGAALGLLTITHNVTAMLAGLVAGAYGLGVGLVRRVPSRNLLPATAGICLGLGLAAFYWWPALTERPLVQLERILAGYYDFREHFRPLPSLVEPIPPRELYRGNPPDARTAGAHLLGLAAFGVLAGLASRDRRGPALLGAAGVGGCLFLMTTPSEPVWAHVPLLAYAEFPWRWLGQLGIVLAWLVGLGVGSLQARLRPLGLGVAAAVALGGVAPLLYPYWDRETLNGRTVCDLVQYEVRAGVIGLTSMGELLPRGVDRPKASPFPSGCTPEKLLDRLDRSSLGGDQAQQLGAGPLRLTYRLRLTEARPVRFWILGFPGWQARIDRQPVGWRTEGDTGLLVVDVPAGEHEVAVFWAETPNRLAADLASGLAALVFAAGLLWTRRRPGPAPVENPALSLRGPVLLGAFFGVLFLGKELIIDPHTLLFRVASAPDSPWGMVRRLDVDFGGRLRLLGYRVEPEQPRPGDELTVTLYWRPLGPVDTAYSSFAHLIDRTSFRPAAASDNGNPGALPTYAWKPDFYYVDTHRLRLPAEMPTGPYHLRVGLYEVGIPDHSLKVDRDGRPFLLVTAPVWILQPEEPQVPGSGDGPIFGGLFELKGYRVSEAGNEATVWLYWRALRVPPADYTRFVHLIDEDGRIAAQHDGQPWQGRLPTSEWEPGQVVPDRVVLALPAGETLAGKRLRVGWYEWPSLKPLRAGSADYAVLAVPPQPGAGP